MSDNYRCIYDPLVPLLSREHKLSHAPFYFQEAQVHYYDTGFTALLPHGEGLDGYCSYWSHILAYESGGFGRRDDTEMGGSMRTLEGSEG